MPRRLRQCVGGGSSELCGCVDQKPARRSATCWPRRVGLDASLANELEVVIHLYAADSAIAGFMLGWDYRHATPSYLPALPTGAGQPTIMIPRVTEFSTCFAPWVPV